ncbi:MULTISPECIES: MgtC/SapB family protein [Fusobacterium]|uniref:MgtC/SapB family protein n=1 Tax=Fusobacterium hominis TaxID=2764326 RepID=A0A7G9GUA3_9FUSO|nr:MULTISPECIES: MgtC/SapB family protein [Fusobacterium]QNM14385.1 MgtC/SapB family protein [Fusobacterium hominis]
MVGFISELSLQSISLRILLAIFIGGMIGYERGTNNRPAGFRTHILVCLGAAIVSLLQDHLRINLLNYATQNPIVSQVLKTDLGRIGAQVVSGIGFLGAGTIIREKRSIAGLTTAASIWVTGCIGLGIGWGFYSLTIISGIAVLIVLVTFKKIESVLINQKITETITIFYKNSSPISQDIMSTYDIFKNHHIKVKNLKKDIDENKITYTVVLPKLLNQIEFISELTSLEQVSEIRDF